MPNVLIAFFVTYAKIKGQLTTASKKEFQLIVRKVEEDKSDEDVQYFASIAN